MCPVGPEFVALLHLGLETKPYVISLQILGWICYIRVDETTYTLWGHDNLPQSIGITASSLLTTELTPTRTIQVIKAGPINVTVTFLSPVDVGCLQHVAYFP